MTVTRWDQDVYGDPIACDAALPKLSWADTAGGSALDQTSYVFHAPSTPGNYTVTCTAEDGGDESGQAGYDLPVEQNWTIVVINAEVKSVTFTSDHGVMTDWDTTYAGAGGTVYNPRGWQKSPAINNPMSHTKGLNIQANVVVKVEPSGVGFSLVGDGPVGALDFNALGQSSTGNDQTIAVTSVSALPVKFDVLDGSIAWSITSIGGPGGPTCGAGSSGSHKIYVMWGSPGTGPTLHRIKWVCSQADEKTTQEGCADKIWDGVANGTTFGAGATDGWALLDGGSGDCDNLARCMKLAVELLGAGPADVAYVRASRDSNCTDVETTYCLWDSDEALFFDFAPGSGVFINFYEAACVTSNNYYAVSPKLKASSDLDLSCQLLDIGVTQWFCYLDGFSREWVICRLANSPIINSYCP